MVFMYEDEKVRMRRFFERVDQPVLKDHHDAFWLLFT